MVSDQLTIVQTRTILHERFTSIPTTYEWIQLLEGAKQKTPPEKIGRSLTILMCVSGLAFILVLIAMRQKWAPPTPLAYGAAISTGIMSIAWITSLILDVIRNGAMLINPVREMASQVDSQFARERDLLSRLRAIPQTVLRDRCARLEAQLGVWEKWLDVTRLVGLLGPPLLLLARELPFEIPKGAQDVAQMIAAAALTGMIIGSISMRTGIRRLQPVVCVLRLAAEKPPLRRTKLRR